MILTETLRYLLTVNRCINPISNVTIGFASPDSQSSNIDTFHEKIKIQSFKYNISQKLRENIIEIFDAKLGNFKAQCEKNHVSITTKQSQTNF